MYDQPNGEQRVKNAMKKIYDNETSLRQMIRSRKKPALWKAKPTMDKVKKDAAKMAQEGLHSMRSASTPILTDSSAYSGEE